MIGNFPQAFSHIGLINAAWPSLRLGNWPPVEAGKRSQ
jgi:hypothetical protein